MTMTATSPRTKAAPKRLGGPTDPRPVRPVPTPRPQARRAPFVAVVLLLLIGGLGLLLTLNTLLAQGSFTVQDLTSKAAALDDREQSMEQRVAALDAPQRLARQASALGMVPVVNPAFMRAGDGRVLGDPVVAQGRAPASPVASTAQNQSDTPGAASGASANGDQQNSQPKQGQSDKKSGKKSGKHQSTDQGGNNNTKGASGGG